MMVLHLFSADRLESSETDVEGNLSGFDAAGADAVEYFRRKVKPCGRSGHGTTFASVDGLIAVAVGGRIGAGNVGRERDVADAFHASEEILCRREADVALAEFAASDDPGLKFIVIAEEEMLTDADFSAGADEAFPVVGVLLELACEEDLDASVQELARGGIARAERLGFEAGATSVKTGGKYFRVVEDQKVGGTEEIGEVAELAIVELAVGGRKVEEAGGGAVGERLLGDEFFGEMVVEVGDEHGNRL